jgi:phosphoribosylpyrophosphate synthetase
MFHTPLALFSLRAGRLIGERVAAKLGIPLSAHEEREFEWGHHKSRPIEDVRGRDVYVVQSLHGDAEQSLNDKLCRLLFFLGALRDADAHRVTAAGRTVVLVDDLISAGTTLARAAGACRRAGANAVVAVAENCVRERGKRRIVVP